jgi:26S proteasome regulatory subunit N7
MLFFYREACTDEYWGEPEDAALVAELEARNATELAEIEAKIEDAKTNLGDVEIREGHLEKAHFLARIGDKESALKVYDETLEQDKTSLPQKLDLQFAKMRLGLATFDNELLKTAIQTAKDYLEQGGDWERRNRLKVYEALYLCVNRDFKAAAEMLLTALATFTCTELFEYETFVFYTIILGMVSLDRETLGSKILKAPEVIAVYDKTPFLKEIVTSLYECDYRTFFESLVEVASQIKSDMYLARHYRFYIREIRVVAYTQFLEPYLSVTLDSMASEFGISVDFLDKEISHYISAGRLNAKINKVDGAIETNRPDEKNAHYQKAIKSGDQLLNSIQKLARVIDY